MTDSLHLQISGDLPWCVLGWRTFEHEDVEPEIAAVYGPVPSKEAAERLAESLKALAPGLDADAKFTVMPTFPVRSTVTEVSPTPSR